MSTTQTVIHRTCTTKPAQRWSISETSPHAALFCGPGSGSAEGEIDRVELDALIEKVDKLNKDLGFELENAVWCAIGDAIERGFVAGWKACKNPESLIFKGAEHA